MELCMTVAECFLPCRKHSATAMHSSPIVTVKTPQQYFKSELYRFAHNVKGKRSLVLTEFVLLARNALWWSGLVCTHPAWTCSGRTCGWRNWRWRAWGRATAAPWSQTATKGKAKQKTPDTHLAKTNVRTYKKPIRNLGSDFFVVFQHSIILLNNYYV